VLWYDFRYASLVNPHVHGVKAWEMEGLFPRFAVDLRTTTVVPPLARVLHRFAPTFYPLLAKLPFLRTHYMALLRKPRDNEERAAGQPRMRPLDRGDVAEVASLHSLLFADHLLGHLGPAFLRVYYDEFLNSPGNAGFVATRHGRIVGFVAGSRNPRAFYQTLYRRSGLRLAWCALRRMARDAYVRRNLLRRRNHMAVLGSLFGAPSSEAVFTASRYPTRLLSIAVEPEERGGGLAAALTDCFCKAMAGQGDRAVGLSVRAENGRAIAFYRKTGWKLEAEGQDGFYFMREASDQANGNLDSG
jgi:ribosomal protein S18 acetylase RimI-like enzyme